MNPLSTAAFLLGAGIGLVRCAAPAPDGPTVGGDVKTCARNEGYLMPATTL